MRCEICGSLIGHKRGCPKKKSSDCAGTCTLCGGKIVPGNLVIESDGTRWHEECYIQTFELDE